MMHVGLFAGGLKGLVGLPRRQRHRPIRAISYQIVHECITDNIEEYETFEGWKGLAVTQLIVSIRRKDGERNVKRSRNRKVIRLEGSPSGLEL